MPLYNKGGKYTCSNSRDISLFSVVVVLIKRVRDGTECAIGEEQCVCRVGVKNVQSALSTLTVARSSMHVNCYPDAFYKIYISIYFFLI